MNIVKIVEDSDLGFIGVLLFSSLILLNTILIINLGDCKCSNTSNCSNCFNCKKCDCKCCFK